MTLQSMANMSGSNNQFSARHIGPSKDDEHKMLAALGIDTRETLINTIVPDSIRLGRDLDLPEAVGEHAALEELATIMGENVISKSFYGQGYHGCHVPPVIQRNLFENPAWYTAYTPYQSEISQGRLELLFHFQTLVTELTGLPVASASLLDEATAVAEAAGIAFRHHRSKRTGYVLAGNLHPQTRGVLETRAGTIGISQDDEIGENTAAVIIAWPDTHGIYGDHGALVQAAKEAGALVIAVADPLALTLIEAPGDWGADIAVGSMQRFGVPMGFGGPHAAYMAATNALTRLMPGRIVGQSADAKGRPGYRLALQTREQHIRRDKATSNICTAQALLANMSAAYAIWHGPEGLRAIAARVHHFAGRFASAIKAAGLDIAGDAFFDTVTVSIDNGAKAIATAALDAGMLLRVIDENTLSVAFDEVTSDAELSALLVLFGATEDGSARSALPAGRDARQFLTQEIFHQVRSETDMMRFLRRLADMDLALDRAMIPLGSCTMKLNAVAELMPVSWTSVNALHPFAPASHVTGYRRMIDDVDQWLSEITGFDKVSFQPNAGSQGEYAGLLAIRRYHQSLGQQERNICLIPSSAHGTNPASAQMAGLDVVVVKCTSNGDIDIADLEAKAAEHGDRLAALMLTYPSTHGVFEQGVRLMCDTIHQQGGQVYLDGANLNALVGLARPGDFGADVCHMNLHKTFCIPHGGGGPGVGPIGVKSHLIPFLPGHGHHGSDKAVSAAPEGSASILPITWMYIRMMGADGLKQATEAAILNANYMANRIAPYFPVLYKGRNGRVAHECIVDTRSLKDSAGVSVEDIAKRLIDFGFHAPTISWPVAGTMMVEPTESEPLAEMDRFCDAMIAIAGEAEKIADGQYSRDDNPLVNAPHTAGDMAAEDWPYPYSRMEAVFPAGVNAAKYWPPISRIDNVAGDRNLVCACPPIEAPAD